MSIDLLAYGVLFPNTNEIRGGDIEKGDPALFGSYDFLEYYCPDVECDCRRVMVQVRRLPDLELFATIQYGWESPEFYVRWMHGDESGADLAGVFLDILQSPSPFAEWFLDFFVWIMNEDPAYEARLRRHYAEVKAASGGKKSWQARKSGRKKGRGRG